MMKYTHYNILADLFRYPDENYKESIEKCEELMKNSYPSAYEMARLFFDYVKSKTLYEIEELFGKTFHIQAICYLDLGYVLFAEDYKRGEFLVQMKAEQEKVNNDCGIELADNLPNVLTLMPLLEDDFREEFAKSVLSLALQKMVEEFDSARIRIKDKVRMKKQMVIIQQDLENANIYALALQALLIIVKTDFDIEEHTSILDVGASHSRVDVLSHTKRNLPF